jgi:hypothetical protein
VRQLCRHSSAANVISKNSDIFGKSVVQSLIFLTLSVSDCLMYIFSLRRLFRGYFVHFKLLRYLNLLLCLRTRCIICMCCLSFHCTSAVRFVAVTEILINGLYLIRYDLRYMMIVIPLRQPMYVINVKCFFVE